MNRKKELLAQILLATIPMIVLVMSIRVSVDNLHYLVPSSSLLFGPLLLILKIVPMLLLIPFYFKAIKRSQAIKTFLFDLPIKTIPFIYIAAFFIFAVLINLLPIKAIGSWQLAIVVIVSVFIVRRHFS